jgi:hypothetical protein
MDEIVGAVSGLFMGVIVIAAIYQLNKKGSPLVPSVTGVANHTLTSIFK